MNPSVNYEAVLLFYSYVNDETISSTINEMFTSFSEEVSLESYSNIGRYDVNINARTTKINMICCYFSCNPLCLIKVKKAISTLNEVVRYMIVRKENRIMPKVIDYKYPIEMKKYIFESMRIIPIELTGFNKKKQRILATNIKRARILGLIGKSSK